ncbi:MAG: hypothetical protein WEB89_07195 [Balneolales bacterium]
MADEEADINPMIDDTNQWVLVLQLECINQHKKGEDKLRIHNRMQELLMKISTTYANVPFDKLDSTIQTSLTELGEFIGADRFYIFDYDLEQKTCCNTYEWCNDEIEPEIEGLQSIPLVECDERMGFFGYHTGTELE